jgi:hypothetical protein
MGHVDTGVIYECVVGANPAPAANGGKKLKDDPSNTVGSIAAGKKITPFSRIVGH